MNPHHVISGVPTATTTLRARYASRTPDWLRISYAVPISYVVPISYAAQTTCSAYLVRSEDRTQCRPHEPDATGHHRLDQRGQCCAMCEPKFHAASPELKKTLGLAPTSRPTQERCERTFYFKHPGQRKPPDTSTYVRTSHRCELIAHRVACFFAPRKLAATRTHISGASISSVVNGMTETDSVPPNRSSCTIDTPIRAL